MTGALREKLVLVETSSLADRHAMVVRSNIPGSLNCMVMSLESTRCFYYPSLTVCASSFSNARRKLLHQGREDVGVVWVLIERVADKTYREHGVWTRSKAYNAAAWRVVSDPIATYFIFLSWAEPYSPPISTTQGATSNYVTTSIYVG